MINKKLEIDRGSTISWDGDPYDAQLRVEALYERDVQLSTLDSTLNGVRTVQVVMNMTGSLENPKIEFSINLPNLNQDQVYQIVSRLQMINRDQQELNRQVFSLLLLGQFAPMGSFFGQGASAGVTSSVSEFLSNQLNNLIGQSLKGDNVNVQLRTARDVVRVALRLSLMNDRLTIERNGAVVTGQNNDMTLGNISIQLKILPPPGNESPGQGVLAVEVFNRENIISSNAVVSSNRGVGIFYKKEFDKLKELIRLGSLTGKKKKRQK
jgi:hypothetical protein